MELMHVVLLQVRKNVIELINILWHDLVVVALVHHENSQIQLSVLVKIEVVRLVRYMV